MHNSVVLVGRLKHFFVEDTSFKLMVSIHSDDGDFILPVYANFIPKAEAVDLLEEDMLIGIKGELILDKNNNIQILASKFTITTKKRDGENNECN